MAMKDDLTELGMPPSLVDFLTDERPMAIETVCDAQEEIALPNGRVEYRMVNPRTRIRYLDEED